MTELYYRLAKTSDPEERLEDAALWKALHDEYGEDITLLADDADIPEDGLFLGRTRRNEWYSAANEQVEYWRDPAFQKNAGRTFHTCGFDDAIRIVQDIHDSGKDAFLKSTRRKHYTGYAMRGKTLKETLGDLAYSFVDTPDCLMVQEAVEMRFEQRFVFIGGEFVTRSPIAWHLTPLDTHHMGMGSRQFETPQSKECYENHALDLTDFAREVYQDCTYNNICIDCAWVNWKPVVVEFNDAHPGQLGLYACDVRAIAKATRRLVDEWRASK